ncbi:MAG: NAD(P)/FAD-dependent oxidoreductase [Planctomycetota bacterium]|nr:NAD(P)/FAD-dependent oxidoreductase [Planctomycetota bacterium]
MEKVFCSIVGGGVVGCAIAYELSQKYQGIFLFEKNRYLGEEQSGRNSGVIHAGIYYKPGSLKSRLCVEGNRLIYRFCAENGVAALRIGKIIVATNSDEEQIIKRLLIRAKRNGVPGVHLIDGAEVAAFQPGVKAVSALHLPTTGIVNAATLIKTLAKLARMNGVSILTQATVSGISVREERLEVRVLYGNGKEERFLSEWVVNAAGLYSDEVARLADSEETYKIIPFRGEYYYYNAVSADLEVKTNVYPAPVLVKVGTKERYDVGVHLTPTFGLESDGRERLSKRILVGPLGRVISHKNDYQTGRLPPEEFISRVQPFFPVLRVENLRLEYAGIQAKPAHTDDFTIKRSRIHPHMINLVGIDSPGLTSSLAVAKFVALLFKDSE